MRPSFDAGSLSDQSNAETTSKVITLVPTFQDVETSTGQHSHHHHHWYWQINIFLTIFVLILYMPPSTSPGFYLNLKYDANATFLHLNWIRISVINLSGVQTWFWKVSAKHTFDVASVSIKTSGILKISLTSFAFITASNVATRIEAFYRPILETEFVQFEWFLHCCILIFVSSHICILNPQSSAS